MLFAMADTVTRLNSALEGRYTIERELGEGGMATVYLADDLKHERKVALKVLKPELAAVVGAERFLAEIKVTANLQHPHILPLHDSGEADSFLFYVMPYVEGETLQARIDREKQLPVDEAVRIATAVAGALQTAHEQGIIHRDIKPANILLSRGEPLIADFGIALAVGAAGGSRLTETGLSVGTPFYMSPEQATGDQAVGASTDTYALGSVLYEMLVGDPPYPGSTAQAVLGKIIAGEPVSAVKHRSSIPANVDAAVRKALEKLPADRFSSAQEFVRALGDEHFRYGELATAGADVSVGLWKGLTFVGWSFGAVAALALGWSALRPEPPRGVERFSPLVGYQAGQPANLLPDGSGMVFRQIDQSGPRLWLRRWDNLSPILIPGTEGVVVQHGPQVSPDGQEVAFIVAGSLRVAPLLGGVIRTLSDDAVCCQRWGPDAFIYYRSSIGNINRVPVAGGAVEAVTQRDGDFEDPHGDFQVLPESDLGVFMAFGPTPPPRIVAQRLSTGERRVLVPGMKPFVTPTGRLLFASLEGQILSATLDAGAMELTGPPTPIVEGVAINASPYPLYTVSDSGELLYQTGTVQTGAEFVWMTRSGQATPVDPGWSFDPGGGNAAWSLSPDGTRLAVRAVTNANQDIWIKELDDGPLSRLTFDEAEDWSPLWAPDGETVTFVSFRRGDRDVWTKRADGTGEAELLYDGEASIIEGFWSPNGEWLVLRSGAIAAGPNTRDILALRPGVDSVPLPLLAEEYDEAEPAVSPDGRWLAYISNETGSYEVYVRPFPDVSTGKWQVSTEGGAMPVWAHSGRELFFVDNSRDLIAAEFDVGSSGSPVGDKETLFTIPPRYFVSAANTLYGVAPDDQRFLMARPYQGSAEEAFISELVLVQNFFEELEARVGN